jgi:hypothetical protein
MRIWKLAPYPILCYSRAACPSSAYLNGIIEKFSPDKSIMGTYYGGQNYTDIKGVK